jgi:GT2 family glycosyltransferase
MTRGQEPEHFAERLEQSETRVTRLKTTTNGLSTAAGWNRKLRSNLGTLYRWSRSKLGPPYRWCRARLGPVYKSWCVRLGPQLWRFRQHPPRALRIPRSYEAHTAPANMLPIAIVTPSFNQAKYLKATIDSVLAQNYRGLAYIVQDGASSDGTVELLKTYGDRLRWRSDADAGQGEAINRGFTQVGGEIMAYLNSDDFLLSGTLSYVSRIFLSRPDVDVVYGHRIYVDQDGQEIGRCVLPPHDSEALKWADYLPQETMFWRRRVWDKVGPINDCLQYALDWDFILRTQDAGFTFLRAPRFLACFRVHDEQKTSANAHVGLDEMNKLRRRQLGREPAPDEITTAIQPYLRRQIRYHWLSAIGVLRY